MIHQKIKELREMHGLSQEELGNAIGVSRVAISQVELGERSIKVDELKIFADVFGVDVNELLGTTPRSKEKKLSKKDKHYKIKQLILYLSSKLMSKQNFWETLLNKLLYFLDFDYYEWTWSLITDEEYVKLPYGPVPKEMTKIIEQMQQDSQIKILSREYFGKKQKTIVPLIDADMGFLDAIDDKNHQTTDNYTPYPELPHPKKLIKEIIEKYGSWNADALSNRSHNDIPYLTTKKIWDKISPGLVFYRELGYMVNPHNESKKIQQESVSAFQSNDAFNFLLDEPDLYDDYVK